MFHLCRRHRHPEPGNRHVVVEHDGDEDDYDDDEDDDYKEEENDSEYHGNSGHSTPLRPWFAHTISDGSSRAMMVVPSA